MSDEDSGAELIERAAVMLWDAVDGRTSGVPWKHAGPWRQRKCVAMARALYNAGLLSDPVIGQDINGLQASRDEWRARAHAAEAVGKLDRKRANDAARVSSEAQAAANDLQRQLDAQSETLEHARDDVDQLQRQLDNVMVLVDSEAIGDRPDFVRELRQAARPDYRP